LWKTDASKEELESKAKDLSDELMKVWQKLYQQPWDNASSWEASKNNDGVVDGEVENEGSTTRV
jgi:hypothetical protein